MTDDLDMHAYDIDCAYANQIDLIDAILTNDHNAPILRDYTLDSLSALIAFDLALRYDYLDRAESPIHLDILIDRLHDEITPFALFLANHFDCAYMPTMRLIRRKLHETTAD